MTLPGNSNHRKILQILLNSFSKDNNILVFGVFGSVGRGNWDDYSDLDLDIIVKDDSEIKIKQQLNALLKSISDVNLIVLVSFEEFKNEYVIILNTLDRISIRFHIKEDTVYHILDSLKILYGTLSKEEIEKSITKPNTEKQNIGILKNKFLELSIYVPISLKRKRLINAEFFLNKMRNTVIDIYLKSRNMNRYFDFENNAEQDIRERISKTYSILDETSITNAFHELINLFCELFDLIGDKKIILTKNDKELISKVMNQII